MSVFCDGCGRALSPNDDRIYYGGGAYCPEHHPGALGEREIRALECLAEEEGVSSHDLDGPVHEQKGREATDINNQGLPAQLSYLCDSWGREAVVALLTELGR